MEIVNGVIHMARQFKTATALNLAGLTVAFAAFYLLATQVDYMQSYNHGIADCGRVFRVESKMNADAKWGTHCNRPSLEVIAQMPQIEGMTLIGSAPRDVEVQAGETSLNVTMRSTTHTPFGAMRPRCLDGELEFPEGDQRTQGFILPASVARKLFGTEAAAGRYLYYVVDSVVVRGVYEDFPENCSMGNYVYTDMGDESKGNYGEWSYTGYVRLHEGVDAEELLKDFPSQMRKTLYQALLGNVSQQGYDMNDEETRQLFDKQFEEAFGTLDYRLRPITETYFSGVDPNTDKGNPSILFVLRLACLLVILIATINFLDFTLAESPMRIKGVNTRRVLGESLGSLRGGLVGESVLTAVLACALAVGLCWLVTRQPTELLQGDVTLAGHPWLVGLMFCLAVVVGVVAGFYPAWFATGFAPALVLKGSFGLTPKGRRLRTLLVGLQLFVSMLLLCYIGILYLQSHYIYTSDYGYAKDELLYAQLPDELKNKKEALRGELLGLPGVESVSFSRFVLGSRDTYMSWGRGDSDHTITFTCLPVDWHYMKTLGINITEGRDFNEHDGDVMIFNEAAKRQWDWIKVGQPYLDGEEPVVGICEDVRYGSTRIDRTAEPVAFIIMGEKYKGWRDQLGAVNIRVAAGVDKIAVRRQVDDVLHRLGGSAEAECRFLDQQLEQLYQDEFRFIRQVLWFAALCLVITLIGVFCLTMFETAYRRKEIGIRKVMGSTTQEILLMFCRHYALLLAASFVLAAPVAWHVGRQWLQGFAERTPIYWWLFPLALLTVGLVTMATVVAQCWHAASENPVNHIKNE